MTPGAALLTFFALEVTLCVIPGPAVLYTIATTLRFDARRGVAATAGIVTGNTLYFVLSGLGVVALLLASYRAFAILKLAGAAYLAYLGLRSLFARPPVEGALDARVGAADASRAYLGAVVTQLANPKAVIFFVAVLPQFVDPRGVVPLQIATLALASMIAEGVVLSGYVVLAERVRRSGAAALTRVWIERAGGAMLLAIAARIAREPLVATP